MLLDAFTRTKGKKLFNFGVAYLTRFIWFIYGTAIVFVVGGFHYPNTYKWFNTGIYHQFYMQIFEGYFKSGYVKIFKNNLTAPGLKIDESHLVENALFVEVIILLFFRLLEIISIGLIKKGNKAGNLFGSIRRVFSIFFALYVWAHSM
jgi:hypothetical protein